ncbi:universal stress protein [Micromonospora musae]|uniref:universal stress protein n=1 Tax=Micromonospora musae TaxID=1894970 RepID=UPI0033F0958C
MSGNEILVGYDGSPDAAVALGWALDEAQRSGRPVRLAYVFEWSTVVGWLGPGVAPGFWPDETARNEVDQLVHRAAADAAGAHPGVDVTGEVLDGPAALLLQERSAEAALLVLGSRGHGGFAGLLVGSTTVTVTAHAHCPVVVVRSPAGDVPVGSPDGPVVVGVDGSDQSLVALGLAAERAAARRVRLRVLRAWSPQAAGDAGGKVDDAVAAERAALAECLAPWRRTFPELDATVEVAAGAPASLLVEASDGAQLVAVGTRGRGGLRGMLLGSVSQQLIQHARCPVAVVRER